MKNVPDLKGMKHIGFCFDDEKLEETFMVCRKRLKESVNFDPDADTILLDSFYSAVIEGARTTLEQVKNSLNNPKNKSDIMVINNMKALHKIYSGFPIHAGNIRKLWDVMVDGAGADCISSFDRANHGSVPYKELNRDMSALLEFMERADMDSLYKGITAHCYVVYSHPFCNGNGSLARVLQNYCLYTGGYEGVRKIRISQAINLHLDGYYKALKSVGTPIIFHNQTLHDLTAFIHYMLERIIEACNLSEKKRYPLSEQEKKLLTRMSKRGTGAEITVANAAALLDVSSDKARNVLNGLAEKRYLFKTKIEGKNKNIYKLLILIS